MASRSDWRSFSGPYEPKRTPHPPKPRPASPPRKGSANPYDAGAKRPPVSRDSTKRQK